MHNIDLDIALFERDRLPELFQGDLLPERSTNFLQLSTMSTGRSLVAVWYRKNERLNPLPDMIVGNDETIKDLCAWCQAFMPGIGPLSSLIRITSVKQLRDILSHSKAGLRYDLSTAGQQISLIFSEVIARTSSTNAVEQVSLKACMNTLSFAIFRMELIGLQNNVDELSVRWSIARQLEAKSEQKKITDYIVSMYHQSASRSLLQENESSDINAIINNLSFSLRRRSGIMRRYSGEHNERVYDENVEKLPKEEILRLVDIILADLGKNQKLDMHGYISLAKLINFVTRNFSSQLSLLGSLAARFPEIILSLGYIRGFSSAPEILSSYNGVGWKLLNMLSKDYDIFNRPECDISYDELAFYGSLSNPIMLGEVGRYTVEIGWGVNAEVQNDRSNKKALKDDLLGEDENIQMKNSIAIDEIERRLYETLDLVRRIKHDGRTRRKP